MKVLLLANQPESTTRLKLFRSTLEELGFTTVVPTFGTRNWLSIARQSRDWIIREKPDVVHLFNVPDIIYRKIPSLKGKYFQKLIYDYRSPWGIESGMLFGPIGKLIGEKYEKKLAGSADAISTVNNPLMKKVITYISKNICPISLIPNYPAKSFGTSSSSDEHIDLNNGPILFVGRISKQEGVDILLKTIKDHPGYQFLIIGDGPFSWFLMRGKFPNAQFLGWQPHEKIAEYIKKSSFCLKPTIESPLTPYATDKSVWKLNEYLNMGKRVLASGIIAEEPRKNLLIVPSTEFSNHIKAVYDTPPIPLSGNDYRYWEMNKPEIRNLYDNLIAD